jgi:ABC-type transport system involved in multi-copper enzyme maturation permease subunit
MMTISAVPAPTRAQTAPDRPHRSQPLWTVFRWELRRLSASRTLWISALLVFALTCLIEVGLSTNPDTTTFPSDFGPRTVKVDWLSNYGLFHNLPFFLGMVLALFIPFLCTDGVALDLKRRTHELVMTTAVPSGAYVWGRYLSGLLVSLGLACVMLLGIVATALGMHQLQPDLVLAPDLRGIVFLWAVLFLPSVLILSGISFGLGTLYPSLSNAIKVAVLLLWFLDRPIINRVLTGNAVMLWDPTSQSAASTPSTGQVLTQLAQQTQHLSPAQFLVRLHALFSQLPDVSAWIGPRLVWIGAGIGCVALASVLFRRFQDAHG